MNQSQPHNINFSQPFMQQLIHAMGEGLYTLDTQGNCTFINAEGERLIGWTLAEIIGKNIHSIIHSQTAAGEFLPREECPSAKSVQTGQLYRSKNEVFLHKNGTLFPVSIVSEALYEKGEITGSVTVFRDISIEIQTKKQLLKATQQVEINTQLKNNLMSNMSHELRTPLNAILGLSHLSIQSGLTEPLQTYLTKIQSSSHKLLNLINDILDLSRIESGKMEIYSSQFSISALFQDIKKLIAEIATKKGLELVFSIDPDLATNRFGDVAKIKKVLLNLARNAIKFTDSGNILMTAKEVSSKKATNNWIQFSIIDTGIGIQQAHIKNLFSGFHQADSSASRQYEGMGLGLGYSKKLVELMGGTIDVRSKINQGSEFFFQLELPRLDVNESIIKAHILLVEDNKINQLVVKNILKKLQIEVDTCENGQLAVEVIKKKHFDLVLMDVQMPVMDGIQATIKIRTQDHLQSLPIIALTANDQVDEIQRCFTSGMNDHIVKPIKIDQLSLLLEKWLGSSYSMDETSNTNDSAIVHEVEGINIQQGLKRLANNKQLYVQLLTDFTLYYQHTIKQLNQFISQNNHAEAERLVHSIKGVAGNIGAKALAQSAAELEHDINKSKPLEDTLKHFENSFTSQMNALKNSGYLAKIKNPSKPGSPSNQLSDSEKTQVTEQLQQLVSYLTNYDGMTEEKYAKMTATLKHAFSGKEIDALSVAIKRFDFDNALKIVQKLLEK